MMGVMQRPSLMATCCSQTVVDIYLLSPPSAYPWLPGLTVMTWASE